MSVDQNIVCERVADEDGDYEIRFLNPAYAAIEDVIDNVLCRVELEAIKRSLKEFASA